jgi:cell shape-determining protein MreD
VLTLISTMLIVLVARSSATSLVFAWLRKAHALRRALVAGGIGFLTSLLASALLFLTTRAAMPMSPHVADQVLTPGVLCAIIAPVVGVLATRYARSRLRRRTIEITGRIG